MSSASVWFERVSIEAVREFWDRRPCNVRHSRRPIGSREYFDEVEIRKYFVEPHIPGFAEFPRWQGRRVLEIGCGLGTDTINFARHGALVTAVDLSEKSLALAQQRAALYGLLDRVRFFHANAEELDRVVPVEPYDLVYAFGVLHHTPRPDQVLRQITRYLHGGSTIKLMLYHRRAWKVLWLILTEGRGRFWNVDELIARHSEAQGGCPVTYTYTRESARALLEQHGYQVDDVRVEHIFPYRIADYTQHRYVREWYFRWMPRRLFRKLERTFGWHLCLTARPPKDTPFFPVPAHVPYPLTVGPCKYPPGRPRDGGVECFDTAEAMALNRARLEHLEALGLDLEGKRVLDAGCGVGHLADHLQRRGCQVLAVDARAENIARLRQRYPHLPARVLDLETESLAHLGRFDLVLCYGLLYHLESPLRALRNLAAVCDRWLLVETIVADHRQPVLLLDDETASCNQALGGLGCRPSPSFVTMALNRLGFAQVYAPAVPPAHPDFRFAWHNNLDFQRDGRLLRAVFLGARTALPPTHWIPLLP